MSGVIWAIISSSGFNSEASWLLRIWVSLSACLLADHQLAAPLAEQTDTGRSVPWTSRVPWPELDNVRDQRARLSFNPKLRWHTWVHLHTCATQRLCALCARACGCNTCFYSPSALSKHCFILFRENPERTFDLVVQVACPTSENEGRWSSIYNFQPVCAQLIYKTLMLCVIHRAVIKLSAC